MKKLQNNLIRSPLHYNGNKFSLLSQLKEILPLENFNTLVEPFCGSAMLSINSDISKIYLNDYDEKIIGLLKYFYFLDYEKESKKMLRITNDLKLTSDVNNQKLIRKNNGTKGYTEFNVEGYKKLLKIYNQNKREIELFLLSNYSFNRMIRFNKQGFFNVPIGKGDLSSRQLNYLKNYAEKIQQKNVIFSSCDFRSIDYKNFSKNETLFYFDPPYLMGNAQYNNVWGISEETDLYDLIDNLSKNGYKFALSNVSFNNGKENKVLTKWMSKYRVFHLDKLYNKTNYNKKNRYDSLEVVVTNIKVKNGI